MMNIEEIRHRRNDLNNQINRTENTSEKELLLNILSQPLADIERLLSLAEQAERALAEFTDKHFHGGSKANRDDYVALGIPTADIYKLREALQDIRGE